MAGLPEVSVVVWTSAAKGIRGCGTCAAARDQTIPMTMAATKTKDIIAATRFNRVLSSIVASNCLFPAARVGGPGDDTHRLRSAAGWTVDVMMLDATKVESQAKKFVHRNIKIDEHRKTQVQQRRRAKMQQQIE